MGLLRKNAHVLNLFWAQFRSLEKYGAHLVILIILAYLTSGCIIAMSVFCEWDVRIDVASRFLM